MIPEQVHPRKSSANPQKARDLLDALARLEAKLEAAIADTRARKTALDRTVHIPQQGR